MTVLLVALFSALSVIIGYYIGYKYAEKKNALTKSEKKALDGFVSLMNYDGSYKGETHEN
ncbi:MAG: hypothetical protein LKF48_07535 [Prevotella sp.]|nr:hypothetical protein [Prevotella sp.]MCH4182991.1 hypothetical protein [Prevotella sp.]